MNKDELKGKAENLMGRAKQAIGTLTGDKHKEGEGLLERLRGTVVKRPARLAGKLVRQPTGLVEKLDELARRPTRPRTRFRATFRARKTKTNKESSVSAGRKLRSGRSGPMARMRRRRCSSWGRRR